MKTISIEVRLVGLTRDGADTWICDVQAGTITVGPVYLQGRTEDDAVEFAERRLRGGLLLAGPEAK